jgi:hypothetical protein
VIAVNRKQLEAEKKKANVNMEKVNQFATDVQTYAANLTTIEEHCASVFK